MKPARRKAWDAEEGPPRTEGVVPLGEGAKGVSGG